jgi:hypothetical protein
MRLTGLEARAPRIVDFWICRFCVGLGFLFLTGAGLGIDLRPDGFHVWPGEEIQDALQSAARSKTNKTVWVHEGIYRPSAPRQALIWLNRVHNGIRLEAVGTVTLTAANPAMSKPGEPGYPAIVNHVVYFGHGITSNTVLRGFRLTGANGFMTRARTRQIEPDESVTKNLFFFTDGGAIKIFGRSSPRIERVEVADNFTGYCGAGVSIQHEGTGADPVWMENCIFRENRTQITGAAVDLLAGSSAVLRNCLFVGNASNWGEDLVARRSGEIAFTNNGVLTIFQNSRAWVDRCTFANNRNGVDDLHGQSLYSNSIFSRNGLDTGLPGSRRFELHLPRGGIVKGCLIDGPILGNPEAAAPNENNLTPPPPRFNEFFIPAAAEYGSAGYRPVPSLQTVGRK